MLGYKKGNTKELCGSMPLHYPADRVYLDGDTDKTVQDECVRKTGDTMSGALIVSNSSATQLELRRNHSGTALASSITYIGNNIPEGTAGCSDGVLRIYGKGAYYTGIEAPNSTANRKITLPNNSGVMALTSDIPPSTYDVENPADIDTAIRRLHSTLNSNQTVSAIIPYGSTNDFYVCGYKYSTSRGRYLVMRRTSDELVAYRITSSTEMEKTTFTGTTQTVNA